MGTVIGAQLRTLGCALLLGMALALVYDLLRALRRRRSAGTALPDVVFCMVLILSWCAFALRVGEGEVRLYALFAAAAGAWAYAGLCAPLLRPLWEFWARTLFRLLRLLRLPWTMLRLFARRARIFSK